jgi:hypothetical protein
MTTATATDGANMPATASRARYAPLTAERKAAFLRELARHGVAAEAARVASPHTAERHGALSTFLSERNRDPQFAADWTGAVEQANAALEREVWRRAVEGTPRGVFQKGERVIDHDGQPATEQQYSDRLLEVLLRSRLSDRYGDKKQIEVRGRVDVRCVTLSISDLQVLSAEQRGQLARIMERIAIARGEVEPGESVPALPGGDGQIIEGVAS